MKLYLLRHAIAEERTNDGSGDAGRMLTDEGLENTQRTARGLQRIGIAPEVILTSPLTRTLQTATIIGQVFDLEPISLPVLAPGCTAAHLLRSLDQYRKSNEVIVVGHQPDLSQIAADLIGGGAIEFKKGGLAFIKLSGLRIGAGQLLWAIPPRILRELGS